MRKPISLEWKKTANPVIALQLLLIANACAPFSHAPALPRTFSGPLGAFADSIFAGAEASYCAPTEHLDYGRVPQGCVRTIADTTLWVNWDGENHVTTVARKWSVRDGASALLEARALAEGISASLGAPLRCDRLPPPMLSELLWTPRETAQISTAVIVLDSTPGGRTFGLPIRPWPAAIILVRAVGAHDCRDRFRMPREKRSF
jgi:hypothetical protein